MPIHRDELGRFAPTGQIAPTAARQSVPPRSGFPELSMTAADRTNAYRKYLRQTYGAPGPVLASVLSLARADSHTVEDPDFENHADAPEETLQVWDVRVHLPGEARILHLVRRTDGSYDAYESRSSAAAPSIGWEEVVRGAGEEEAVRLVSRYAVVPVPQTVEEAERIIASRRAAAESSDESIWGALDEVPPF